MDKPDQSVLRILDANLNRAREALRVMEEYARLGLDDAILSGAIKETRHALAHAAAGFECDSSADTAQADARGSADPQDLLIRSRDIVGDAGRELAAPAEYEREDARHVVVAAGKRLSEALRVVEEYSKTIDPTFAAAVEKIRYEGYELERRLHVTFSARERLGDLRLYVILTESLCHADWFTTAEASLRGGADCLQLREKNLPDRELLERAKKLCRLCHDHDALFIINDRPDVAILSGADGVHIGQDDMSVASARRIVPPTCLVGVSTHNVTQIEAAASVAPDYIAVGPMFPTSTKPQDHIAGPLMLTEARKRTSIPLVPIGGITANNASDLIMAGATCLCVCASVIAQPDAASAALQLRMIADRASGL